MVIKYKTALTQIIQIKEKNELNERQSYCNFRCFQRFLCCHDQNKRAAQLKILTEYRGKLLGTVQDGQEKLYCLDYLIRKLKTEK